MDTNPENEQGRSARQEAEPPFRSTTPLPVRVLALLGALAMLALSIAYAWSIATGGIFLF